MLQGYTCMDSHHSIITKLTNLHSYHHCGTEESVVLLAHRTLSNYTEHASFETRLPHCA